MPIQRNVSLEPRQEGIRNPKIKVIDIDTIEAHFRESIKSIDDQFKTADDLIASNEHSKAQDIWRAQIVFIYSAFDFFLHEIVKLSVFNIYNGDSEKHNDNFLKLQLTMKELISAKGCQDDEWLLKWIDDKYSTYALVPEKAFSEVCNLIGIQMKTISDELHLTKEDLKKKINDLCSRRNIIAHQSDRERSDAERNSISKTDVTNFLKDTQSIANKMIALFKKLD